MMKWVRRMERAFTTLAEILKQNQLIPVRLRGAASCALNTLRILPK